MQNWKLTLAYDGTDFHGWQVQPGQRTIQGELQSALGRITGEAPLPQGSGRTDAGVHALAQVAGFQLQAQIPAANLHRALNRILPAAIRILVAQVVPDTFHARHSALAKTYEYRVLLTEPGSSQICPPFLARYVYAYSWRVDIETLQQAARQLIGQHDFRSFSATDPDLATRACESNEESRDQIESRSTVRTIYGSEWAERPDKAGDLLVYRVRGNGFLHHMVRNLVGTMLEMGRGYLCPDGIPNILAALDRAAAGPTAPPQGLFLHSVEYD
jgi:tRNA pseudouridine38-40 synthase